MTDRVLDEHAGDLLHADLVRQHLDRLVGVDGELVLLGIRHGAKLLRDGARGRGEVEADRLDLELSRVEAREVEEIRRQPRQPVDLVSHLGEEVAAHGRIHRLVAEELDEPAEREERRPELVRGVGDELAPGPVEDGQAGAHVVERVRELADLVAAGVDDRRLEVAARHALCRGLEPARSAA